MTYKSHQLFSWDASHAKNVLYVLQTVWQLLYSPKSVMNMGTLFQLKNVINRSCVPRDPKDNMKAAEDFFLHVVYAHIIVVGRATNVFNTASTAAELAKLIVANHILLPSSEGGKKASPCADKVYLYAQETLTLGLLWLGFHDAIREGDGDRMVRYWKMLLVLFKSTRHPNYAKEGTLLLMQFKYHLSERQREQLLWSRCINTRGYAGCNVPCDLHLEFLNKRLKGAVRGMGGNVTPKAIVKAAESIRVTQEVCSAFEEATVQTKPVSNKHSYPAVNKDVNEMVRVLEEHDVFTPLRKREHSAFSKIKCGVLQKHSRKVLIKKVQETINTIDKV